MGKSGLVVFFLGMQMTANAQQASEPIVLADALNGDADITASPVERCPGIETLSNKDAPVLIYNRVVRCADLNEYDRAAELMFIAMSFGKFDSMRVEGKVRQHAAARSRIKALNKLDSLQLAALQQSIVLKFKNTHERQQLCTVMRSIGQPAYQPEYMLNYYNPLSSRQTHLSAPSAELPLFEQELAWENVFLNFARCPG